LTKPTRGLELCEASQGITGTRIATAPGVPTRSGPLFGGAVARRLLKTVVRDLALVCASPFVGSYYLRSLVIGRNRALEGSTQLLSMFPGLLGRYVRVAFLRCTLAECDPSAAVEFGTIFSQAGTRLGPNVYIGPGCHIGLASIEADALIGAGVHIPSGPSTHGIEDLVRPIREQPGRAVRVRVGSGSWIGSAAVVLADVGEHTVVGAGSVVVKPLPAFAIAAGVPARVTRDRRG
jgi:virginiamycin A acetyltransferase